jgi:succinate dehydrogenase / fumarate reductase flavoprotein subunit
VAAIRHEMGVTMHRHLGVFRDEEGMEVAQATISKLRERWTHVTVTDKGHVFNTGLIGALELGFMLDCAETIIKGALSRKESRGAHFRTDYLERDDEQWLKHILLYDTPNGSPRVEYLPVCITQWEPQTRVY